MGLGGHGSLPRPPLADDGGSQSDNAVAACSRCSACMACCSTEMGDGSREENRSVGEPRGLPFMTSASALRGLAQKQTIVLIGCVSVPVTRGKGPKSLKF